MTKEEFIDFYEVLELSCNAHTETIEHVFRCLAHRLHPDTGEQGDQDGFDLLVKAFQTIQDSDSRAVYDVEYRKHQEQKAELIDGSNSTIEDSIDRHRVLSMFYAQRRRNMKNPGVGIVAIEQVLECPADILEFHLWYFRERGWIDRVENGLMAITAAGVDEIESRSQRWASTDWPTTNDGADDANKAQSEGPSGVDKDSLAPETAMVN